MKKRYAIIVSAYATMEVEANSPEEAKQIALNDFEDGKCALISSIEQNGYEAEYDDDLTEELEESDCE